MTVLQTIVTSVAALLGVVVGAVLQWFLTRRVNRESRLSELQAEAYSRFLVWDRAGSDDKAIQEACRARTFLVAYGSRETVRAIADYERLGGVIGTAEQNAAFTRMFNALRADRGLSPLDQQDLLAVMYLDDVNQQAAQPRLAADAPKAARR